MSADVEGTAGGSESSSGNEDKNYKRKTLQKRYSDEDLKRAAEAVMSGEMTFRHASEAYHIPVGTIAARKANAGEPLSKPGRPTALLPMEERALAENLATLGDYGLAFDMDDLRWGFDLYPERRGGKYKPSWTKIALLGEGREMTDKFKCERNVWKCAQNSPLVKLLLSALKSSGCEVDLNRHISCEVCDVTVNGGYDSEMNQVVVCQNVSRSEGLTQAVLTHELIHMFDYCRNKLDFTNVDHLACTEIRAANLAHCSFMSALMQGDASPFNIAKAHQNCVKTKAMYSVMSVRRVSQEEAMSAINRVFNRCYNDLEPIGRRVRRNSYDMVKAYKERFVYGYE